MMTLYDTTCMHTAHGLPIIVMIVSEKNYCEQVLKAITKIVRGSNGGSVKK